MRTKYEDKEVKLVHRCFPLLYKRCEICGIKFKFEFGWKYIHSVLLGIDFDHKTLYLCKICCPTYEQAYEYFKAGFSRI